MRTISWREGTVVTIDQTKLPHKSVWLELQSCEEVASAIESMKIRGAPLIGAAGAYGLALAAFNSKAQTKEKLLTLLEEAAQSLRRTRPTGANLFWALDRVLGKAREASKNLSTAALIEVVVDEAQKIADEDADMNLKIGQHGSKLIEDGDTLLTHCNAGSLATVDYGTALGVIRAAWQQGKKVKVFATETRPRLQGARLTTFELKRAGIPTTLITDNMVGYVMTKHMVNKVVVGADRIVRDAVINKIGTYTIAVMAHEHNVPFYVAAPSSTFDLAHCSEDVIIEQRKPAEVTHIGSERIAPIGVDALNPAFDSTPMNYVTALICENGVLTPKELERLAATTNRYDQSVGGP